MSTRLLVLASLSVPLLALAGCSAEGGGARPQVQVPWSSPGAEASSAGPARWAYAPRKPAGLLGRLELGDGKSLYFGKRGERWLYEAGPSTAEAAGDLAEQDLVAAARSPGGGLLFIGQRGAMFEAPSPLAPFTRVRLAPEPVVRMDASSGAIVAVTARGGLLRSVDGGATFSREKLDAQLAGDVALLEGGRGLLLAFPERLFSTDDGGSSWKPLDAPTVGALEIVRQGQGSLVVRGLRAALLYGREGAARVIKSMPESGSFELPAELPPPPDARSIREGRGLLRGGESWVVFRGVGKGRERPWVLGRARLGERMAATALAGSEDCARVAVDADERFLYVACAQGGRSGLAQIKLRRYADPAGPPDELSATLEGALGEARLSVGSGGRVLVSGACRPGASRGGCDPDAPLALSRWEQLDPTAPPPSASSASPAPSASSASAAPGSPDAPASPWVTAQAPSLNGRPLSMRFSPAGAAYLLGRRGKSNELALFVSHDGGKSFEGHDLGLTGDGTERRALGGVSSATLSALDEGTVSIALEGPSGAMLVVTDEDGRVLTTSQPPASTSGTRLGVAGRRALAVDAAQAFESLDGGVSWQPLGEVPALRCDERDCDRSVACGPSGCLVGPEVARVGWGGPVEPRRALDLDARFAAPPPPRTQSPLVCRLNKERWAPLSRGARIPGAGQADRGKTAWAVAAEDPSKGSVTMIHALAQPPGKIEEAALLPPSRDPQKTAVYLSDSQVEGAAAMRFEIPSGSGPKGAQIRSLEVAWENLFEGKLTRASVADVGMLRPGVVGFRPGGAAEAHLWASISNGGVFVRPFSPDDGPTMYFVDHRGKSERSSFPDFPSLTFDGRRMVARPEAVREGNKSVPVAFLQSGTAMLRQRPGGPGGELEAMTLFPPPEAPFDAHSDLSFSYLNGAPLLVQTARLGHAGESFTNIFPFRADGPLLGPRIAGPTQAGLAERFRPCSAQDRAKTARVVAPADVGTRRAVIVEGPDGARFAALASEAMVLYGTRESPCGGALEAIPVHDDDTPPAEERDRAIVSLSDLEHAWYFRVGANDTPEARVMRCRTDPQAQVPASVQRLLETGERPQPAVRGGVP